MAIVTCNSTCALCGEPLLDSGSVSNTAFFFPATGLGSDWTTEESIFSNFDDNGVHHKCIKSWSRAGEFVEFWNNYVSDFHNGENMKLFITRDGFLEYLSRKDKQ